MQNNINPIKKIAEKVQQHYMQRFSDEYNKLVAEIIEPKNIELFGNTELTYSIDTDVEFDESDDLSELYKTASANVNNIGGKILTPKKYRQDIVIRKGREIIEDTMVWPTIHTPGEEFDKEDIPDFPRYRGNYNNIDLEIQPFPWNHCKIVFTPNADPALGAMDLWFQKWYYSSLKPNPFKQVIHLIVGPHKVEYGNDIAYIIDFGTAPPEAFCELIESVSHCKLRYVFIR